MNFYSLLAACGLTPFFFFAVHAADPTRLTHDGKLKLSPVFVNAQEIVFATHEIPNLVALIRLKLTDGTRQRLHPSVTAHQHDPAFSADGRYHAYAMSSTSPQLVLVIQDTKEKLEAQFRPREARAVVRGLSFTPDNQRVIFSISDIGGHQIASVNVKGQDLQRLTESAGSNITPAVSPDGKRIAFSSSRDGDYESYLMNADGNNVQRLTKSPGLDIRPAWSPDSKQIAFTSNRGGNYEIYVMNADGSHLRNVTKHPEKDDFPVWHPDGKKILTVSERQGKFDLYLHDVPD